MNRKLLEKVFEENRQALVVTNTEIMDREMRMQSLTLVREALIREFERNGWPAPIPGAS